MEKFILPQQGWLALQDASRHSAATMGHAGVSFAMQLVAALHITALPRQRLLPG